MPPVAGYEEQLAGFEDKFAGLGIGKKRKPGEVRIFQIVHGGEIQLLAGGIKKLLLVRRINYEFLPAVNLHQKRVGSCAIVMKNRKGSAFPTDVEFNSRTPIENLPHITYE